MKPTARRLVGITVNLQGSERGWTVPSQRVGENLGSRGADSPSGTSVRSDPTVARCVKRALTTSGSGVSRPAVVRGERPDLPRLDSCREAGFAPGPLTL